MGGAPAFSRTVATNTSLAFLPEGHLRGRRLLRWGECRKPKTGVPHTRLRYPPVSHAAGKTAVHSRLHACSLESGVPDVRARPDA